MLVRLGPFLLERPIARGGMAEVWRGVHASEQVPVAVKVLTGAHAREEAFVRALKNEIHAVARLDHPGIIVLYDRGEVTDDAAAASGGRLVAGSPWFAMEMCTHGALSPRRFPLPWKTTRMLLLSLLDALAHAHARGVIHRDLKPGNVLLCSPDDPRPGLKLSDFGIAQPLAGFDDSAVVADAHSGTPRYMAPEQFTGKARELGPWTDLYALGCIAFQLAAGEPPFSGDPLRLAVAHCHDPVPSLTNALEKLESGPAGMGNTFPLGFEAWVLRLLEKEPRHRFRVAADAAWALLQLTPDDSDTVVSDDWENALRSLKPRPLFPDDDPSEQVQKDETAAHTLGPPRLGLDMGREHPSADFTPAPPPGVEETTGDQVPLAAAAAAAAQRRGDEAPTALARFGRATATATAPPTAPPTAPTVNRHLPLAHPTTPQPEGLVIADDDPFAAVLAFESRDRDDDPPTDPRTWAPQAPWTELLALADAQPARDEHPTIAGPFDRPPSTGEYSSAEANTSSFRRVRAPASPPPLPPNWRRPDEPLIPLPPVRRLLGAGLGLYGLRQPPFVDRVSERDRLWRAVVEAHDVSNPRDSVVVVRGPAGIGRSRIGAWIGERAAEVGGALSLFAGHSPEAGDNDGVIGALVRFARAHGLRGDALRTQMKTLLQDSRDGRDDRDDDAAALAAAVDRTAAMKPRERHTIWRRTLAVLARKRPVVLVIDDAQWGDDAIAFARTIPGTVSGNRRGIVVVVAVFDEALAERSAAASLAVEELCRSPGVDTLQLPPLPTADHQRLVEELLGLEPRLADLVAQRSAGNPRFAVELVGDFVERNVLELLPGGFGLKKGEAAVLPDDLHAVWSKRLQHLLASLPEAARICLELGAVLGKDGDISEWLALCEAFGIKDAESVVNEVTDALERAHFVVDDHGTLRFAHAMLRESMARMAHEAGRLQSHHRLIARVLSSETGPQTPGGTRDGEERRARHLLSAGDLDVALPLLLSSATAALSTSGSIRAVTLIDEAFAALDRHNVGDQDPRRLQAIGLRARALADAGRYAESAMWARLIRDDAPAAAQVEAWRALALAALRQGNLSEAVAGYEKLLAHAESLPAGDSDESRAERDAAIDDALLGLADGHYYRGQLNDAGATLARALERAQARGDDDAVALCLWSAAYVSLWRGDLPAARDQLLRQQMVSRRAGLKVLAALGRNALGDVERVVGRFKEAAGHYDEAARQLRQAGSGKLRVVLVNRALCALGEDIADAVARAERLLSEVERAGERVLSALCHGILAVGASHDGDWSAADAHLAVFSQPHQQGLIDGEIALLAERVAGLAFKRGDSWRGAVTASWAREIWTALGRVDRLETLPEPPPVGADP